MSYYVQVNGIEVRCETPDEVIALAKLAPLNRASQAQPHPQSPPRTRPSEDVRTEQTNRTLRFLTAVNDAGEDGIGGDSLVEAVGCNGPAGLGTVVQVARRLLGEHDIDFADVAEKVRHGDKKVWIPNSNIKHGIRALREAGKE